jgi:hypothetical protein
MYTYINICVHVWRQDKLKVFGFFKNPGGNAKRALVSPPALALEYYLAPTLLPSASALYYLVLFHFTTARTGSRVLPCYHFTT